MKTSTLHKLLRSALLSVMLLILSTVQAASPEPDEQDFAELEALIANTADLTTSESDKLANEMQLAHRQLTALQQRRADIERYTREANEFKAKAADLQAQIHTLIAPRSADQDALPDKVDELVAKTTELEAVVRQLSQSLFESRESEAALNERATAIAGEMTQSAAQIDDASSLSENKTASWQRSASIGAASVILRTGEFLDSVRSHVALEMIKLLQIELATLAPRQTIASLESRMLQIRLDSVIERLDQFREALSETRLSAARSELEQFTDDITGRNTAGSGVIELLMARLTLLEQELPILRRTSTVSQSILHVYQVKMILARVANTGAVNDALAGTVRQLREELPEHEVLETELKQLRLRLRALQVNRILWEAELRDVQPPDAVFGGIYQEYDKDRSEDRLTQQIELLSVANRLSDRMITLESALIEAQTRASQVRTSLEGSVLWLRTNQSIGLEWFRYGYSALQWLVSLETWRGLDVALSESMRFKIIPLLMIAAGILALLLIRPRLLRLLRHLAERVGDVGEDDYWVTPLAFLAGLLLALPIPLMFLSAYWVVRDVFVIAGSVIPAITAALLTASAVLALLLFFKALSRQNSVFPSHFSWPERTVSRLNAHLQWFVWVFSLCAATFSFAAASGRPDLRYAMGVGTFLLVSLALSALLNVLFHPNRGIAVKQDSTSSSSPFSRLGLWALISLPTVIGLLPLFGYLDTAVAIQKRVLLTGLLSAGIIILIGIVTREFMVAHRRMSLSKARARRFALEAERSVQETTPVSGDATPDLSDAWDDDYKRTATEAQQLFRLAGAVVFLIGVWAVWKPMFPVLDNFNDIVLWQAAVSSNGSAVTAPVTLGKLLFAATLLLIGFVGARNLRGLLELLLFERLRLDTGTRYAVNAIASYTLLGTTLLIAVAQLGVDWSRLQWIVAALGVGLGFGLQEIVANFISGLIILFERPVRVGDTVTIGGISGTVSNIQIRATTLTDFDNRDVVLPNKSIITEEVTNWTLHDAVTRILLNIGVAYGSDIDQVRQLLEECLESTEHVLATPEPTVFFVNHGASSLDFEIRAFVATPAYRLPVTHALNSAINRKLSAHGIEIPFPQHMVHMAATPD